MALISCRKCGNMVSDRAKTCPKCGEPIFSDEATQLNTPNQVGYAPQGAPAPSAPVESAPPPSTPVAPTPQATPVGRPAAQVPPPVAYGPSVAPVPTPAKRTSPVLIGILSALGMAVLLVGGFALYKYVIEPKNAEPEQELVSFDDSSTAVEVKPVSRENHDEVAAEADDNFEWLSYRYATMSDIVDKTSDELRIMRNSVYARHGRFFKDPALREYFNAQPWYDPYRDEVPNEDINEYEKKNVEFLKSHE